MQGRMRKAFFADQREDERATPPIQIGVSERKKNAMSRSCRPSGTEDESLPAGRQASLSK